MTELLGLESWGVCGGVKGIELARLRLFGTDRAEDTEGRRGISMTAARVVDITVAVSWIIT